MEWISANGDAPISSFAISIIPSGITTTKDEKFVIVDPKHGRVYILESNGDHSHDFPLIYGQSPMEGVVVTDRDEVVVPTRDSKWCGLAYYTMHGVYSISAYLPSNAYISALCTGRKKIIAADSANSKLYYINEKRVLSKTVTLIPEIGEVNPAPAGLIVKGDYVIVGDYANHCIRVVHFRGGGLVARHGTQGQRPGQLELPSDLLITPKDEMVVIETGNNRLQLWDSSMRFKRFLVRYESSFLSKSAILTNDEQKMAVLLFSPDIQMAQVLIYSIQ